MQFSNFFAYKILNSRKQETIAIAAEAQGKKVEASAPSGASKGKHEVQDFSSRGIDFSIDFLNVFGKKLISEKINFETFDDLEKIEMLVKRYDSTTNFEFIGGNSLCVLEACILKAMAASQELELWQFLLQEKKASMPRPLGNCIGGGLHAKQEKKTDFQEFLVLPRTKHFFDAQFINLQAYKEVENLLAERGKPLGLTDENALATTLDNESTLALLQKVKEKIKEKFDVEVEIGIDIAASTFWKSSKYCYKNFPKEKGMAREEQISYLKRLTKKNSLFYLEDPLHDDDFKGFATLLSSLPNVLICGDDLTCTRVERLEKAIKTKAINSLIVKPNQVASLLEAKKVFELAKKHEIMPIISHRSGETNDNFIAHLAVGWQIPIIKTGILGKERVAKLNELIRIEKCIA